MISEKQIVSLTHRAFFDVCLPALSPFFTPLQLLNCVPDKLDVCLSSEYVPVSETLSLLYPLQIPMAQCTTILVQTFFTKGLF